MKAFQAESQILNTFPFMSGIFWRVKKWSYLTDYSLGLKHFMCVPQNDIQSLLPKLKNEMRKLYKTFKVVIGYYEIWVYIL